jgi:hypothetical protein
MSRLDRAGLNLRYLDLLAQASRLWHSFAAGDLTMADLTRHLRKLSARFLALANLYEEFQEAADGQTQSS